jgi:hypothetical protein
MSVTGQNIPCSFVDADLNVRIDQGPGVATASFTITAVTTCPAGLKAGTPEVGFTINGDVFGPYSGALPASVTLTGGAVVNISGTFLAPVFAPVPDGIYNIFLTVRAEDECGNADLVTKQARFEKRPPNPLARLGSSQSGSYVEGDFADRVTVNDWKIEGTVLDFSETALPPAAGQKIRLNFFDREQAVALPGVVEFDYSSDIDLSSDAPTGGAGAAAFVSNLQPYLTGGTGANSDGATPNSGDLTLHLDKKAWATANGLDYTKAVELGVTLQVQALGYWSNVAESFCKVYYEDVHFVNFAPSGFSPTVTIVGVDTVAINFSAGNDTFNLEGPKFTQPDNIRLLAGANVETVPPNTTANVNPCDPSGVNMLSCSFINSPPPPDFDFESSQTFPALDEDFMYLASINGSPTHDDTGVSGLCAWQFHVEVYGGPSSPSVDRALQCFSGVNNWDPETGEAEIAAISSGAVNGSYLTVSGFTIVGLLNFKNIDLDPFTASQVKTVFLSHKEELITLQTICQFTTSRGNKIASHISLLKVYAY